MLERPTALVIVDMQNDYCLPEGIIGSMGFDVSWAPRLAKTLSGVLERTRERIPHIYLRTQIPAWSRSRALREQYARSPLRREVSPHLVDWYGVAPREGDTVIEKHRYSGFIGTSLAQALRAGGFENLILTGVTTEVCVESTARDAFMLDYGVIVLSDCTEASTPDRKAHSLSILDTFFATVTTSEALFEQA
jgi:ureidoacrylate peracid hydrolase